MHKRHHTILLDVNSKGTNGIVLFALGGALLLDSVEYVLRIAFITSEPVDWLSFGTFTAFISLMLIGIGIHFILESTSAHHMNPNAKNG
jgi:uncharacterized membrane protein